MVGAVLALAILARAAHGEPMMTLAHNRPAAAIQNAVVGTAEGSRQLTLSVSLKPRAAAALAQLLADLHDPSSPRYHRWLSGAEFSARFGPAPATVASVVQWLKAQGLVVEMAPRGGQIRFNGTVSAVQRAFQTTIATYGDGTTYANLDEPHIPARLAEAIAAISGLDNMSRSVAASRVPSLAPALRLPALSELGQLLELPTQAGVGAIPLAIIPPWRAAFAPSDFYTFYDEPAAVRALDGQECIAIVGDSDYLPAALALFNSQFNLPNVAPTEKLVDGSNPGIGNDELEALLDLEWSHVAAPRAPQVFYLDNPATGSLADAIAAAVEDNLCRVISISFDYCGQPPNFYTGTLDPLFAQAAAQGQSVLVGSGDWGAANLVFDPNQGTCVAASSRNVSEMAADPNVTAVGGSEFQPVYDGAGNDVGFTSESVYNDSGEPVAAGAGGGGASMLFAKPSYQSGPGVPADNARDLPDVALMASPYHPGAYFGEDNAGSPAIGCCAGGTSLAAPLWGGVGWLLSYQTKARLGNLNPGLYRRAAAGQAQAGFRDITIGDNSFNGVTGYQAGAGYDLASGWGTLDVNDLLSAWTGLPTPTPSPATSPTATPSAIPTFTASPSASATLTVTPVPTPTGSATPTVSPTPS
ncbi:MAG TPA: protease pro-enzyme activation domain-containing protein, partial [Candidatus Binataceae bacterium]|nr:protease pro-enzyme activation domain-containing protein [Candidatus Binataceae bacterium]